LLDSGLQSEIVDHKDVSFGLVRGGIEVKALDGWVVVDVAVRSPDQISLVFDYDSDDIAFYGLTNIDRGATMVESSDQELKLTHSGTRQYYLAFVDNPSRVSDISIRFEAGGDSYEESIRTGPVDR
jgi:hypothetical protein